ncbi:SAM-dependent methyltransferase [Pseudofrankia sp. DC12]|uniref:SAM-dependent methyltransferase n=1 Tax=Pseudofrankia sp. DC12 TaxID=683315 RepID=UPI002101CEB6|nr:SAM-dependent methyltransferase [Pseudofrankia sp. DC12]
MVWFFDGLELLKPGVVSTPLWRPGRRACSKVLDSYTGFARIPPTPEPATAPLARRGRSALRRSSPPSSRRTG